MYTFSSGLQDLYQPPKKEYWTGRIDSPNAMHIHEIVKLQDITQEVPRRIHPANYALIGFCSDEGVKRNQGRIGTSEGPNAFRKAFGSLPCLFPHERSIFDFGDILVKDGDLSTSLQLLSQALEYLIKQDFRPLVIGGGQELSIAQYNALKMVNPQVDVGVVNFDAHFDMREPLKTQMSTSGSSFYEIAQDIHSRAQEFDYTCIGLQSLSNTQDLFEKARKKSVISILAEDIHLGNTQELIQLLDQLITKKRAIYLTIDLDVFSSSYAPGVSAPQPLGLFPWHVIPILKKLTQTGKIVAFDICELNPRHDLEELTAKLSALLAVTFITCDPLLRQNCLPYESK